MSTTSARLLAMAETFARQGRPAMAEAARRAAVVPSPPIEWSPPSHPRSDRPDAGRRWHAPRWTAPSEA